MALGLALLAGVARAGDLPSGQQVTFHDRAVELQADGQRWLVLRYLAPAIGRGAGDLGYADVAGDIDALCAADGIAAAAEAGEIDQVVVVLMDRPVPRGAPDPEATMFIGAYAVADGRCLWR